LSTVVERTIAIIIVVWAIGVFTDPRWRALAYSLPIPITIVLVSTGDPVVPAHLAGVVLLVAFFRTAAWLRTRAHSPMILIVPAAVLTYVVGGVGVAHWWKLSLPVSLASCLFVIAVWTLLDRRSRPAPSHQDDDGSAASRLLDPGRLMVIVVAAAGAAVLGGTLGSLVVTFPYSGVPLIIDSRSMISGLARGVTYNAVALIGFFAVIDLVQDSVSRSAALALGWAGFAVIAVLLHPPRAMLDRCRTPGWSPFHR
jgi:hypothetical protein